MSMYLASMDKRMEPIEAFCFVFVYLPSRYKYSKYYILLLLLLLWSRIDTHIR